MEKDFRRVKRAENGCWNWDGSKDEKGYGLVNIGRKTKRAHRIMFELLHGPLPSGLFVCHRCDNPSCLNPDHLFAGTALDNNRDREEKGRGADRCGEKHPMSKLTNAQTAEIRSLGAAGELTHMQISKMYGVTRSRISDIISNVDRHKKQRQRAYLSSV